MLSSALVCRDVLSRHWVRYCTGWPQGVLASYGHFQHLRGLPASRHNGFRWNPFTSKYRCKRGVPTAFFILYLKCILRSPDGQTIDGRQIDGWKNIQTDLKPFKNLTLSPLSLGWIKYAEHNVLSYVPAASCQHLVQLLHPLQHLSDFRVHKARCQTCTLYLLRCLCVSRWSTELHCHFVHLKHQIYLLV